MTGKRVIMKCFKMIKEAHLWLHFERYLKTYPYKGSQISQVIRVTQHKLYNYIRGSLITKINIDIGQGQEG